MHEKSATRTCYCGVGRGRRGQMAGMTSHKLSGTKSLDTLYRAIVERAPAVIAVHASVAEEAAGEI